MGKERIDQAKPIGPLRLVVRLAALTGAALVGLAAITIVANSQ